MTKDALHDVLIQTGEECKTLIDNLVQESIDTIKKSNHKPNPPKLARIECPHCGKHSHLIVRYEVGSVLHGIVFYSGGFEPVDQGPSDDYFDDREAEYYCSNCEEDFSHTEATDLISEYNMKYDKKIETDIDMFEGFWE
jgi:DNA-directed RNA polymerase subunit RPC12/RpoP